MYGTGAVSVWDGGLAPYTFAALYGAGGDLSGTVPYMATKMIEVRTTDDGLEWLKEESSRQGITVSDLVRRAVEAFPDAEPKYKTASPRSNRVTVRLAEELVERLRMVPGAGISDVVAGALRDYQFSEARTADGGVRFRERGASRT